jgi:hypothetical protein
MAYEKKEKKEKKREDDDVIEELSFDDLNEQSIELTK